MSRGAGLPRVDVDTGIAEDPKFRRLARAHPELAPAAFVVYVSLLGASWRAGERLTVADAWPSWLPENPDIIDALSVDLVDAEGRILAHAWDSWYGEAAERVEKIRAGNRERQARRRTAEPAPSLPGPSLPLPDLAVPDRTYESRVSHALVTRDSGDGTEINSKKKPKAAAVVATELPRGNDNDRETVSEKKPKAPQPVASASSERRCPGCLIRPAPAVGYLCASCAGFAKSKAAPRPVVALAEQAGDPFDEGAMA